MNAEQERVVKLLRTLNNPDGSERLELLADYLGYHIGFNPVNPDSDWKMLLHEDLNSGEQAVLAVLADEELTEATTVQEVRKRHEQVTQLKENLGSSYIVPVAAFVGKKRVVLYQVGAGNRDNRLDLTIKSILKVPLYAEHFNSRLMKDKLRLEEDEFGFGYDIVGLADLFQRALSGRFQQTIELYRKKLSEAIAGSNIRSLISPLLTEEASESLEIGNMAKLIEDPSFKSGLGCVVDTIILRQLLRRFLEGYYGIDSFNMSGIALGVGAGTMESALQEMVQVYRPDFDDRQLQNALQKRGTISKQLTMEDLFLEEEAAVTSAITFKQNGEEKIIELYEKVRRQFEIAYGGDLFAGSVAIATNNVEQALTETFPELMVKLLADTSTEQYSFRYEDLPPELLQQQYEDSMSRTVQIQLLNGEPVVYYGNDRQEQKGKGAYYTNDKLVTYMVKQSVESVFEERLNTIKEAIKTKETEKIEKAIEQLLSIKIVDMTCGGGSFLRGAFHYLTERHQTLSRLDLPAVLVERFSILEPGEIGLHEWEKHLLTNVLYGVDIDYKALIICSQTMMLSALRHWQAGQGFPELIGRTLIHQNALIGPVPFNKRKEQYEQFQKEICQLLEFRKVAATGNKVASRKAEELRQQIQLSFKSVAHELLGSSAELLFVESLEINVPEVFFNSDGTWNEKGGFDVAIGNPPWEIWKANAEEFFERYDLSYRQASKQQKLKIQQKLFVQYPILQQKWETTKLLFEAGSGQFLNSEFYEYQKWKVNGRFTGSDINLYKVSIERFHQVVKENGYLSILVPGSIATDQGATGLRHLLLHNVTMKELLSFENKKGIFESVHRSYKIALITAQKSRPPKNNLIKTFFYRYDLKDLWHEEVKVNYPLKLIEKSAPDTLSLLEIRADIELDIIEKMYRHPLFKEIGVKFTNELHKTNDSEIFKIYTSGLLPLYEGKLINQYTIKPEISFGVEKTDANKTLKSTNFKNYRMVYRSIARSTDKRTLIATILPRNSLTTNSLFVQKISEENYQEVLALAGLFNSFALDFILRRKVSANINLFYINQLPIPRMRDNSNQFDAIVIRVAHLICVSSEYDELARAAGMTSYVEGVIDPEKRQQLQNQIDAYIAKIYGLSRQELIYILSTFESTNHKIEMRRIGQGVVEAFDELNEKGAIAWPE